MVYHGHTNEYLMMLICGGIIDKSQCLATPGNDFYSQLHRLHTASMINMPQLSKHVFLKIQTHNEPNYITRIFRFGTRKTGRCKIGGR